MSDHDTVPAPEGAGTGDGPIPGIADDAAWHDEVGRPHHIYHGSPIAELL